MAQKASGPKKRNAPAPPPRRWSRWALPGVLAVAALSAAAILVSGAGKGSPAAGATASTGASAADTRPVLGASGAPVLLAEYGDFQCTSCEAFFTSVEPQIRAAYIDTGKVRLAWHDFPWIGQESKDAANAARCAGDQGKFWPYHDLLYRSQGGENSGAFAVARLKAFGAQLGLDATAFNACVDGKSHAAAVAADFADAGAKGFNGTPTFLIGTQRIVGAQPFTVFAAAIDAALGAK